MIRVLDKEGGVVTLGAGLVNNGGTVSQLSYPSGDFYVKNGGFLVKTGGGSYKTGLFLIQNKGVSWCWGGGRCYKVGSLLVHLCIGGFVAKNGFFFGGGRNQEFLSKVCVVFGERHGALLLRIRGFL